MTGWRRASELSDKPETPPVHPKSGKRFAHVQWASLQPGDVIEGTWFQRPRVVTKGGRPYLLGEVEHADGTRTGFTMPTLLREQLESVPVGSWVTITYRGVKTTLNGYSMMQFDVSVTK
jgi:hypothetical protein